MENAYADPDWELLLKSVVERREDDLLRLVAADWLDERGETERAEFIRLQIERTRDDRPELAWRETALQNNPLFGPLWALESCPNLVQLTFGSESGSHVRAVGVLGPERVVFRRGFVEKIVCPAAEWLKFGSGIVPRQPIRELILQRYDVLEPNERWDLLDTLKMIPQVDIDTDSLVAVDWLMNRLVKSNVTVSVRGEVTTGRLMADGMGSGIAAEARPSWKDAEIQPSAIPARG